MPALGTVARRPGRETWPLPMSGVRRVRRFRVSGSEIKIISGLSCWFGALGSERAVAWDGNCWSVPVRDVRLYSFKAISSGSGLEFQQLAIHAGSWQTPHSVFLALPFEFCGRSPWTDQESADTCLLQPYTC